MKTKMMSIPTSARARFGYLLLLFCSCTLILSAQEYEDTICIQRGVVNISVSNIHSRGDFESPMETQALLGTPVKITRRARWYQVEVPGGYLSWVHRSAITLMDSLQLEEWLNSPRVLVTSHYGWVYSTPSLQSLPVSDVVSGCTLILLDESESYYQVRYPDGRIGYLPTQDAIPYGKWMETRQPTVQSLMKTILSLTGIPYLWAGTSSKGVDCSGLIQLAASLNGKYLPRNSSQQARVGTRLDCSAGYQSLRPGDLVFFGQKADETQKERVTHIGVYLGEGRFVHAQGYVRTASLDPLSPEYDAFNHNRWLGATRICDEEGLILAPYLEELPFYLNEY